MTRNIVPSVLIFRDASYEPEIPFPIHRFNAELATHGLHAWGNDIRDSLLNALSSLNQTPKSPISRCACWHETQFECQNDKSGFGDFWD
jgi:hypothetical protein